jgi:AAA family ATP:ADP antiporter
MVTSQFWVISNIVFNIREAKRLFGFIGAGAIIGGIIGGYLASIIANYLGTDSVIFVAASLLLLCLPIIVSIWKIRINRLNKYIKKKRKKEENESISSNSFLVILKSKHLINISAVVGVSVLVAKLVDYQFSYFSHIAYPNPDELASFFGFWYSSFNIVALLIQLFLTNKLLTSFNLSKNMLILPLTLLLASVLFLIFPELWVVILLKGIDTSFKQSINKASFELSILPISYETKKQAKPFIDVVVDSIATGLSGLLLLFIIKKLNVSPTYISLLTIVFIFIWFYLILRIKKSYFNTFKENITATTKPLQKQDSLSASINILSNGSEIEILNF